MREILVLDDDLEMQNLITEFLMEKGHKVYSFSLPKEAIRFVKEKEARKEFLDLVISDINMPELNGIDFIKNVHRTQPELPIILITAFGSVDSAVDAIRAGAFDYVIKPFQLVELNVSIDRALRFRQLQTDNSALRQQVKKQWTYQNIVGKSPKMKAVLDLIPKISMAKTNILLTGESGTGKEVVARAIHESGERAKKPFIAINCSAIPSSLMESELFGHAKGSFTGAHQEKKGLFEEANGGSLFLDEIGDLEISLQAKLLRVIQERKIKAVGENKYRDIDVRIICATHKDLKAEVKKGSFREDLFYRLSVLPIHLPPLRERREDIPRLAEYFLDKYSIINASNARSFSKKAMEALVNKKWEGNVRELENMVERAVVLCSGDIIGEEYFESHEEATLLEGNLFMKMTEGLPSLEDLEKKYMEMVLSFTKGRKEKASKILGINRRTLYRKERLYGFVQEGDEDMERGEEAQELV